MKAVLVGKWVALLGFTEILKACPPVWMQMILTKANMVCTVDHALSIQPLKCLRWKNQPTCMSFYSHKSLDLLHMPQEDKHQSPHIKENEQSSSLKEEESCKISGRTSGTSSPWAPDSMSSKKSPGENALPKPRNSQTMMTLRITAPPSSTRTGPAVTKAAGVALTRRAATLPASVLCPHSHALPLWNTYRRDLV